MDNLQIGDILLRIDDDSMWKFMHYRSLDIGMYSIKNDNNVTDFPPIDKNFVHVKALDKAIGDWVAASHEEFPTNEFRIKE